MLKSPGFDMSAICLMKAFTILANTKYNEIYKEFLDADFKNIICKYEQEPDQTIMCLLVELLEI